MYFASISFPNFSDSQATIAAAIFALIGGVVGYFLKYYLDKKGELASENAKIIRSAYTKYVEELLKTSAKIVLAQRQEMAHILAEFKNHSDEFYRNSLLYASPKVVKAYADFVRIATVGLDQEEHNYELMLRYARLYKAMRRDIGLGNWGLGRDGELLIRANIKDYDTTLRPYAARHKRLVRWLKIKRVNISQHIRKIADRK